MKSATKYKYEVKYEELKKKIFIFVDANEVEPVYRDAIEGAELAEQLRSFVKRKDCPIGLLAAFEKYESRTK